jgi:DNA-directed RNA polymerase II subunit RPB1
LIHKLCEKKKLCESDAEAEQAANEALDEFGKERKKTVTSHGGCGALQPSIIKAPGLELMATYKHAKTEDDEDGQREEKRTISPQEAQDIFRRISDDDLRTLGLSVAYARPEWMILTVLPVPPPPVRPSVSVDGTGGGMRSEDDLTYKLSDIIRANQNIRRCEAEGSPQHIINEFFKLLQFHVATLMDNNVAGLPAATQKNGRALKTIRSRLKGKEGRLRGNLMGKRVNFSARTVITGDPNLSLDEVGVPFSIARILTYPEAVTPFNIQELARAVKNGPFQHPGARYVWKDNGDRTDLRFGQDGPNAITIQYGWIVERHIRDGDYIIFNRQPSLHKESMMGHRVRVLPYSTFRLNLSVTTPYNADFDGDEMNLHVPQSEETRAEVKEICMVPLNIVSPQRNGPLMGIVQDSLCGSYKMCRRDVFLSKREVMSILMWVPEWDGTLPAPAIWKPRPRWTGKQLISLAFPRGLNLNQMSDPNPLKDDGVLIQNGELMFGLLSKKTVGVGSGGVIHTVYNENGWEVCVNFFNGCQRIVNYWMLHNGFSIGVGDTVPDPNTIRAIEDAITVQKKEVEGITAMATANELEALPGMNVRETFESKVSKALNDAREVAGTKTSDNLKDINNAVQMSRSGSKGSNINISQMTALVGQQSVEGKRVPFGFSYRTLPHFTKDDYSPEARGFVENSYLRGLTPTEFFFHAMAGREGLIDTAVKTAETGYIQRRLVKALEDCTVKYDGTVRNSLGDIIQFVYGEDGMDGQHIERQKVDMIMCSDAKFEKMFRVDVTDPKFSIRPDLLEQASEIEGDIEVQRYLDEEFEQLTADRVTFRKAVEARLGDDGEQWQLPLNIARTIESAKTKFRIKEGARSDLHPVEVITKVREMLDTLVVVRGDDPLTIEAQNSATMLFKALLRSRLAFKRLVVDHSLNKLALDNILGDIGNRFLRAQASPGEMVGVLAAQSIGEPATQMTLNTFHFTGISSKNVTLGVPRLKEILNASENLKTPSMMIYMQGQDRSSQEAAKRLRSAVEHTSFRSVCEVTEIYYDPDIRDTVVAADKDTVEAYFIVPDDDMDDPDRQSKWMLRIVLGRRKLLDKGLTVSDVAAKVKEDFQGQVAVIFSDNNADEQVIRIRQFVDKNQDFNGEEDEEQDALKQVESFLLKNLTIRGVEGIDRAFIDHKAIPRIKEDGSITKSSSDPLCEEWFLNTSGSAFKDVLELEGVDATRCYTNSFLEVVSVLGIEAGRAAMARELWNVLSFDGSYVNDRHLAILSDVMTARGKIMPITRHGINRAETGALMRCSFEETVEILLDAAAVGELDDCRGISENVMLGQLAPLGTGDMEIHLDEAMMLTASNDNQRYGIAPVVAGNPAQAGSATPYDIGSPLHDSSIGGADYGSSFSPIHESQMMDGSMSEYGPSTAYGGSMMSPYNATSPYNSTSPYAGATSPYGGASPAFLAPTSPFGSTSPMSPAFSPKSPGGMLMYGAQSPASPAYTPGSPAYQSPSATSPQYSPTSPSFSPTSPSSPQYGTTSPQYSPTSPSYSPKSPGQELVRQSRFSPKSPYSPTSPVFSPASPAFVPNSRQQIGNSSYSPTSPQFNTTSPSGNDASPTSPQYSPTSPQFEAPP